MTREEANTILETIIESDVTTLEEALKLETSEHITDIKDGGRDWEVTVDFEECGTKKMFASFAKLQKVQAKIHILLIFKIFVNYITNILK